MTPLQQSVDRIKSCMDEAVATFSNITVGYEAVATFGECLTPPKGAVVTYDLTLKSNPTLTVRAYLHRSSSDVWRLNSLTIMEANRMDWESLKDIMEFFQAIGQLAVGQYNIKYNQDG